MLKNSQLHLHFDLKRLCQESSLKQLKIFKRGKTLNFQDHWKSKRKHWLYSSFKRCAIFPYFSKILIIFPIQRGHDPIPRRDVTTLLRGYYRWYYTYVLSRSFLSNDWLTSQILDAGSFYILFWLDKEFWSEIFWLNSILIPGTLESVEKRERESHIFSSWISLSPLLFLFCYVMMKAELCSYSFHSNEHK